MLWLSCAKDPLRCPHPCQRRMKVVRTDASSTRMLWARCNLLRRACTF